MYNRQAFKNNLRALAGYGKFNSAVEPVLIKVFIYYSNPSFHCVDNQNNHTYFPVGGMVAYFTPQQLPLAIELADTVCVLEIIGG